MERHCRIVGDLDPSGEEYSCAVYIDNHPNIIRWVRNTVQPTSFWLQTSGDKFYPDFLGLLNDGRVLCVEYKGADRATNDDSKEKKLIGDLWAERSDGKCLFLMVQDKQFAQIDQALRH